MKKVVVMAFLTATTVFTSCNKDDDSSKQDPIIGSWEQIEFTSTFEGEVRQESINGCDNKVVTAVFRADGTAESGKFEGDNPNDCEIVKYTWKNLGVDGYSVTADGEVDISKVKFTKDTFTTISEPDASAETDVIYTAVYKRVK